MPNYTLTIKAAIANELVDAFTQTYHYQAEILDAEGAPIPNPESATAFTKRKVMEYPVEVLKAHRAKVARDAAVSTPVAADDITIS